MMNTRKTLSVLFVFSGALLTLFFFSRPAAAVKPLLPLLCKAFNLKDEETTCRSCHTFNKLKNEKPGENNVNAFGKDLKRHPLLAKLGDLEDIREFSAAQQKLIIQAMQEIARYDSDGDGASNIEELQLGTNPGDATNKPDDAELAKYRKEHPDTTPIPKPASPNKTGERSGKKMKERAKEDKEKKED